MMGKVQTSDKAISSGVVVVRVEIENGNLWLLLDRQALQLKLTLHEFDNSN